MAEDGINAVQQQLGLPVSGCVTREHHLTGSQGYSDAYPQTLVAKYGVSEATARHLTEKVGTSAAAVLELAKKEPGLDKPIIEGYPAIRAEVSYAARNEMAATLDDVLERRTGLQFYSWEAAMAAAPVAAAVMQREMGWDGEYTQRAIDEYVGKLCGWTQKIGVAKSAAKA
jgi:glycerol-3-phosphate dehydrogenase